MLGKKNVLMQAYGQSMINLQMFHNGMWHDATLKNVWYVPDGFMEYNKWYDMTLSKSVGELVLTCTSAKDIWDKLCARFECSSTQWLNMLFESFFQAQHDCKEDISTHVAKLQKRLST